MKTNDFATVQNSHYIQYCECFFRQILGESFFLPQCEAVLRHKLKMPWWLWYKQIFSAGSRHKKKFLPQCTHHRVFAVAQALNRYTIYVCTFELDGNAATAHCAKVAVAHAAHEENSSEAQPVTKKNKKNCSSQHQRGGGVGSPPTLKL